MIKFHKAIKFISFCWLVFIWSKSAQAQFYLGHDYYNAQYPVDNKLQSIKEYKLDSYHIKHVVDLDSSTVLHRIIEFDSLGKLVRDVYLEYLDQEEPQIRGYAAYEKETTEEIKDSNNWVIEVRYLYDGEYRHSELFDRDEKGRVIRVRYGSPSDTSLKMLTTYDSQDNPVEIISYHSTEPTKYIKTYNDRNQLVTEKRFKNLTNLNRIDSNVYDNNGNRTASYFFDFWDGVKTLTEHYVTKYDEQNRRIWFGKMNPDSGNPEKYSTVSFNKKGFKINRKDYRNGEIMREYIWKYKLNR